MPFLAPSTIPQIHFAPYSSLPKPPVGTILYDRVYNDDHATMKVQVRNLLKRNKLSGMPIGFPFHCARDAYGRSVVSYSSYEFREHFCFSDQRSRTQSVTFTYTAPHSASHSRTGSRMMAWKIMAPERESTRERNAPATVTIAHVQVDPLVMETSFGLDLMTNPRIIQEALALSIELGILITIQIANHKTPRMYPCKRDIYYDSGEIVFLATDNSGRSEVVFVFEP